ncbi:MAG TPA: type II toxin-antitoxin system RelE/ParE family toxin [Bryobacteraceae bacterium]|nr:type II toxin-antitoxin system RelE/ParE family toxin [Bryobacteraceae bacterium]
MSGFRLLPEAEYELDDIWLYVARESGSADIASRLIDTITERFWFLAQHPQIGRRRDHDLRPGLRSFLVGEYVIIYRIEAEDALILHVIRGSRDIVGLLED